MSEASKAKATKKRRLRAPEETLREKTDKARDLAAKPRKPSKRKRVFGFLKIFAWVSHRAPLKQVGHALRWFFTRSFMRFLGKILGFRYIYNSWQDLKLVT